MGWLTRKKKTLRIEGPRPEEGPTDDGPGVMPETEDGPIIDMDLSDGVYSEKKKWYQRKPKIEFNTLNTLTWDGERYVLRRTTIPVARNPRDAVHVTGEKGQMFLDLVDRSTRDDLAYRWPEGYKKADAIDLYLYTVNNRIRDILMITAKDKDIDWRRYVIYGIIAATAACVAWVFIGPMLR